MTFAKKAFYLIGMKAFNSGTGFILSFMIIIILGANETTDALFIAMFLPVEMARMISGRLPIILVPVLTESYQNGDKNPALQFLGWWLPLLLTITILLIFVAPWLVKLMAPGLICLAQDTAADLLMILAPSFLLFGLFGHGMSLFYYKKLFLLPEIAQFAWRIVALFSLILAGSVFGVYGYAAGLVLAGCVQLIVLYLNARSKGFQFLSMKKPDLEWPYLKPIMTSGCIVILALLLNRATVVIDRIFASLFGPGSISILFFSDRIARAIPLLLATSLFTLYLPKLSSARKGDHEMNALRMELVLFLFIVGLPIAILLFWAAKDLITLMTIYGHFLEDQIAPAVSTIQFYCFGIPAIICSTGLRNTFLVERNLKDVALFGVLSVVLTLTLDLAFYKLGLKGLALASSLTVWIVLLVLWKRLKLKTTKIIVLLKILRPALLMMIFLFIIPWSTWNLLPVIRLLVGGMGALIIYSIAVRPIANQIKGQISN